MLALVYMVLATMVSEIVYLVPYSARPVIKCTQGIGFWRESSCENPLGNSRGEVKILQFWISLACSEINEHLKHLITI